MLTNIQYPLDLTNFNLITEKEISTHCKGVSNEIGKTFCLIVRSNVHLFCDHIVTVLNVWFYIFFLGEKISYARFDTSGNHSVSTTMPLYLQTIPSEVFVFVILHNAGDDNYYKTSIPILQSLSGAPHISDQLAWGDAWTLLGYKGKLHRPSWRRSVMKNLGYTPAVIEDVIPKTLGMVVSVVIQI